MTSFIVKVIMIPLVIFIGMYASGHVDYGALWQPLTISAVLIAVGLALEYMLLRQGNLWLSTLLDLGTTFLIIWLFSNSFANAEVTFLGAFTLSVVIGVTEYFLHRHLIGAHKVKRATTQ